MSLSVSLRVYLVNSYISHLSILSETGRATMDPEAVIGYRVHNRQTSPPFDLSGKKPLSARFIELEAMYSFLHPLKNLYHDLMPVRAISIEHLRGSGQMGATAYETI
jgi:hypothetical protein